MTRISLPISRGRGVLAEGGCKHVEALKNNARKVVGTKQVLRGLKAGTLAKAYVANDADTFLFQRVVRAAEEANVPVVRVASMKELGTACSVAVPTAAAGLLR